MTWKSKPGSREFMAEVMDRVFEECKALRGAGQQEYARREENAFSNFERVAERLKIPREKVLMVYMEKHLDGIHSWVDGHRSQRENVMGRLNDVIVYACLLRGMIEQTLLPMSESASAPKDPDAVLGCGHDAVFERYDAETYKPWCLRCASQDAQTPKRSG